MSNKCRKLILQSTFVQKESKGIKKKNSRNYLNLLSFIFYKLKIRTLNLEDSFFDL